MNINGLEIPEALLKAMKSKNYNQKIGSVPLKVSKDSYGYELETEIGELYNSDERIRYESKSLAKGFAPDGIYGEVSEYNNEPGFINDIIDFQNILSFAISSDGAPFCLDYRDKNKSTPCVIWWQDVYWRKVSDNLPDFLFLFDTSA